MRIQDQVMLALTAWRENRGGGVEGMQSVANVILNRASRDGSDVWSECIRRLQFSSITAVGDPELTLWPADDDQEWLAALGLAEQAAVSSLEDITHGATLYYAAHAIRPSQQYRWMDGSTVAFPLHWNPASVTPLCSIAGQLFFRECR